MYEEDVDKDCGTAPTVFFRFGFLTALEALAAALLPPFSRLQNKRRVVRGRKKKKQKEEVEGERERDEETKREKNRE